jgi:hypothetical protein
MTKPTQAELVYQEIDLEGNPLPPTYDKLHPFFLKVMSFVVGQPKNLQGQMRQRWMQVQSRATIDSDYARYVVAVAVEHPNQRLTDFFRQAFDDTAFNTWTTNRIVGKGKIRPGNPLADVGRIKLPVDASRPRLTSPWATDTDINQSDLDFYEEEDDDR